MSLEQIVKPILDSKEIDTRMFDDVKVYNGLIENEVNPPLPPACFLGSWYRKVFSSKDYWLGIEGLFKIGEFIPDEQRFGLDEYKRYMDNPSIYMGGNSCEESDCGLNYNIMYIDDDVTKDLTLSSPKLGFRPFFRYIYKETKVEGSNVERNSVNSWNVSNPRSLQYYYFPGDVLRMKVYSPCKDYLQLRIEVVKPTNQQKYVDLRKKYNLPNGMPDTYYSPIFYSKGHGYEKAEFKRVNSIDQYGNEGITAKDTQAVVERTDWYECYLYRKINGEIYKVPFNRQRQASMICPNEKAITVENQNDENGGESVTLHPGKVHN